jgi:hypothetical protein
VATLEPKLTPLDRAVLAATPEGAGVRLLRVWRAVARRWSGVDYLNGREAERELLRRGRIA